jgi:hypothetical protein
MFRLSIRNVAAAAAGLVVVVLPMLGVLPGDGALWGWMLAGVAALVVGSMWVVSLIRASSRQRELADFADRIGWTFAERSLTVASGLTSYPFGTGVDREDVDVVTGVFQGRQCAHFTRRFAQKRRGTSASEDVTVTQEFRISSVELGADYPTIDILPEDVVALAAKLVGGMDVDFESAEFNRRWRVKGGDARYVHDMITPRVMDRLVQDDARGMALRIEGRHLMTWRAGRTGTEDLATTFSVLTSVAAVLPPHVERELREEQEAREANAPDWATTPGALTSGHYTALGQQMWEEAERRRLAGDADDESGRP